MARSVIGTPSEGRFTHVVGKISSTPFMYVTLIVVSFLSTVVNLLLTSLLLQNEWRKQGMHSPELSCKMVYAIWCWNHISLSTKAIINVIWESRAKRRKECFQLRHYSLKWDPYCCTLHNLPEISIFCYLYEMNKTFWPVGGCWMSGKILAIATIHY